ncbi:hypothetical protein, partial [Prevotellamassilia timonensis]|uniref:hypothetical protein n=1 Tax=Prevotellamassilia timonensis TaxID=1852370 RepID=UPI00307B4B24
EDIFYILSFFVQSLISEMPPLSDRRERIYFIFSLFFCAKPHKRNAASFRLKREDIFYILSFFVQSLISEMSPLSDRK